MLQIILYIVAALLPAGILLSFVYRHDRVEKEPSKLLWKLFFLGVLSALPACVLELIGSDILAGFVTEGSPLYTVASAFLVIALVEEGCKLLFLKLSTWRSPAFNYRFDAVVYAVFVSLGFAAIENVLYVFQGGLTVALPRALLSIPAHAGFAVFMGILYGNAKLCEVKKKPALKSVYLILSLVLPIFLHGFYDACAMLNTGLSVAVFFVFVLVMFLVVLRALKKASLRDEPLDDVDDMLHSDYESDDF